MTAMVIEMIVKFHVKSALCFSLVLLTIIYCFLSIKGNSVHDASKNSSSVLQSINTPSFSHDSRKPLLDKKDRNSRSTLYSSLSIEDKIRNEASRRNENYEKGINFSDEWILERLEKYGLEIREQLKERMLSGGLTPADNQEILLMLQSVMPAEETFLNNASNLEELKSAAEKRSTETGLFYGNKILTHPIAYRNANVDEIVELLDAGAVLPENVIELALFQDNIEVLVKLDELGYPINEQYVNNYNGMNALEVMMEGVSIAPSRKGVDRILQNIDMLLDLGVPIANYDGTRDALDLVLHGALFDDGSEVKNLLDVAQHLHKRGFFVQKSHQQLLAQLRDRFPEAFSQGSFEFY